MTKINGRPIGSFDPAADSIPPRFALRSADA
jgi:hypothetical protein